MPGGISRTVESLEADPVGRACLNECAGGNVLNGVNFAGPNLSTASGVIGIIGA